ncbi:MAG: tRNA (5-methylaminomethyl-2-thiouridine)(34)-methyltransferase MnmD [Nanobdellota archaeon]
MKKIITNDGSVTFWRNDIGESYHTNSGAEEEAVKKYIEPSLEKHTTKGRIRILDVCFGLGYNTAAALDRLDDVEVVALENDKEILSKIKEIESSFDSYDKIKEAAEKLYYEDEKVKINIILGDALETIRDLDGKFDFIFHDPFSATEKLWSYEMFEELSKRCKGVLTTYRCARRVRENLKKAGFTVEDVEPVGRKAPSTIAW